MPVLPVFLGLVDVALWLVGVVALILGAITRRAALRKAGTLIVAVAIAVGLPLVGGVALVLAVIEGFPAPVALLLLVAGAFLIGTSLVASGVIRRQVSARTT